MLLRLVAQERWARPGEPGGSPLCSPYSMVSVVAGAYTASGKRQSQVPSQPGVQGIHVKRMTRGCWDHLSITWAEQSHAVTSVFPSQLQSDCFSPWGP